MILRAGFIDGCWASTTRVIHGIGRGEAIFGPRTAQRLLDLVNRAPPHPGQPASQPVPNLTTREHEVLELIARGRRNHEIAAELFLSERSVRNYLSNILTKLHVDDRAQAITTARDAGLRQPPASQP